MKKKITKRSIKVIDTETPIGRRTSVTLEDRFWDGLKEIAAERGLPLTKLVAELSPNRENEANFSSSLRIFVVDHFIRLAHDRGEALALLKAERQAEHDEGSVDV